MENLYLPIIKNEQSTLVMDTPQGITYREGNIFFSEKAKYICNISCCRGLMSGGFSKQIKELYPRVYSEYRAILSLTEKRKDLKGKYLILDGGNVEFANLFCIYPFANKYNFFDIVALESAIEKFAYFATCAGKKYVTVAIPKTFGGAINEKQNKAVLACFCKEAMQNEKFQLEIWNDVGSYFTNN